MQREIRRKSDRVGCPPGCGGQDDENRGGNQPFIAPIITPWLKYFWTKG